MSAADTEYFVRLLREMALVDPDEVPEISPLSGGVSADIVLARTRRGAVCVKHTLAVLKVAQEWKVSPDRGEAEKKWIRLVGGFLPEAVPKIVGDAPADNAFAMRYLDPESFRNWKTELSEGRVDRKVAAQVGAILGEIHRRTAGDPKIAREFANDENFADLRLRPYFETAAMRNEDVAATLQSLVQRTAATKQALVHGDFSPKNILIGPAGPVILDAECAWYGDPAFDAAFCLTHLLLKSLWKPRFSPEFLDSALAFWAAYRSHFGARSPDDIEENCCTLLPALLLARVDGKSPVEYFQSDERDRVRAFAKAFLPSPVTTLPELMMAWREEQFA